MTYLSMSIFTGFVFYKAKQNRAQY